MKALLADYTLEEIGTRMQAIGEPNYRALQLY